tara:strand:+ start:238 stop:1569 length:1332 start_codon:yes stop_codon:yes gene_type:complete
MRGGSEVTTGPIPVGQFVNLVRNTIRHDQLFQNQVITGEITQWKQYPSGHTYFTLRDSDGQISAVIWKGRCRIDPIIEEGSVVVVIANLDLYAKSGRIQLVVNRIEPVNKLGLLEEQKKLLIETLRNEGLLDRPRQELPTIPKHIAIITGTGSAALSDMNRLIDNRWPSLRRTVIGVTVQGENAANQIVRGLLAAGKLSDSDTANRLNQPPVDLIIIGRGGGAPEDLWAFNLEPVVRAIIASKVPVISAVGHESDLLVSDLVADLRASTPSNAVERGVPEYDYHQMLILHLGERLDESTNRLLQDYRHNLQFFQSRLLNAPLKGIYNANQQITDLSNRLSNAVSSKFSNAREKLQSLNNTIQLVVRKRLADETTRLAVFSSSLNSAHPKNVLERGYSMITKQDGTVVSNSQGLAKDQQVILALSDGEAKATIDEIKTKGELNE